MLGRATSKVVYWARDLLPEILPKARVLTYGHDTHIRHKLVRPPIEPHSGL